jgi:hypothetical protein
MIGRTILENSDSLETAPCDNRSHFSSVSDLGCCVYGVAKRSAAALVILLFTAGFAFAFGPPGAGPGTGHVSVPKGKSSLIEGRFGYLFGFSELRLRDGDNANSTNIAPMRRDIDVTGLYFELQGETFVSRNLAVRAQGWVNVPEKKPNDFYDPQMFAWDTKTRFLGGDLAAVYHFGIGGTPYAAGIIAGYRYQDYDLKADRKNAPGGIYYEHTSVHIPHLGVYYAHSDFLGAIARLDISASPLALSLVDARRHLGSVITEIDGHSVTGVWFEGFFQMALPISEGGLLGAFTRYNYLELSGGATVETGLASTRFSMDSRYHLFAIGITAAYTF